MDTFTCMAGRALAMKKRKDQEDAKKENLPDGHDDGVHYYVTPVEDERQHRPEGGLRG